MKNNVLYGHEEEIGELKVLFNYFNKSSYYLNRDITPPKGVVIYGKDGNGKSLLGSLIKENSPYPCFIYNKSSWDNPNELKEMIKNASKQKSVLIIDDLDALCKKEKNDINDLYQYLESDNHNIFIIALASSFLRINPEIVKPGLLDHKILFKQLKDQEQLNLLNHFLSDADIHLPTTINDTYLTSVLRGLSGYQLKLIVNNIALKYGMKDIKDDDVYNTIAEYQEFNISDNTKPSKRTAIHEAGHAIIASLYPQFFDIVNMSANAMSGKCVICPHKEYIATYKKVLADINVDLAGLLADQMLLKDGDMGSSEDLENARSQAAFLVNRSGYIHPCLTLPCNRESVRKETWVKHYKNERYIDKILKRQVKEVKLLLRKNKDKLITLANALYEKGRLNVKEINLILNR